MSTFPTLRTKWNYLTHSSPPCIYDIVFTHRYKSSIVYSIGSKQHLKVLVKDARHCSQVSVSRCRRLWNRSGSSGGVVTCFRVENV